MAAAYLYEPAARCRHVAAAVYDKVYVWGGLGTFSASHDGPDKTDIILKVDVLDVKEWVWQQKHTTGSPPLGIVNCAFTVVGRRVVIYGGWCGHGSCYHNSLHELNTINLEWKVLAPSEAEGAPMKKNSCGIVVYSRSGEEQLCVFGGYGVLNSASHPTAQYEDDVDGRGFTNELHIFTSGCWSNPTVTGSTPPSCSSFSFTKISEERVVMFGGYSPVSDPNHMNYIYTLVLSTLHWIRVSRPDDTTIPWPVEREYHSSCLLAGPLTGHQHPMVIVVGGRNNKLIRLSDLWVMKRETWKKVTVDDETMIKRREHTITAITITSSLVVVIVFGGRAFGLVKELSDTVVLEFELQQSVNSEEEWVMTMAARLTKYRQHRQLARLGQLMQLARLEQLRQLARLEQLMREKGKLTMSVVKCIPLGPPRIGKTCLKDRLAGKKPKGKPAKMVDGKVVYPNEVSMSTGTVEDIVKMVVETTYQEQKRGKQWVQCTFNQEIVSFIKGADSISTQVQPSRLSSIAKQEQPNTQSGTQKMPSEKQSSPHGANHANQHSSVHKQKDQSSTSSVQLQDDSSAAMSSQLSHDPPQVRYALPEVISKALLHEGSSQVQSLEGSLMIHFIDTGGQSEFHEVLPALVSGPCIFFLCFSLPAGLSHQYKMWYDCHNGKSRLYDSSFSVKAVMLQCLGSISCIGTQRRRGGKIVIVKPKVFFIGTQQDLVNEEEIKQIDSELRRAIEHREELNSLVEYRTTDPPQVVFPVNSYDEKDKSFQAVREAVHAVAEREEEMYKVSLPVPFATLDFCIRKCNSLSPQQVYKIANKFGLSEEYLERYVIALHSKTGAVPRIDKLGRVDLTDPTMLTEVAEISSKYALAKFKKSTKRCLAECSQAEPCVRVPVLSLDEFVAKAKECNVSQDEIKDALWTLHHLLGTIRHFPESPELKDLVITNSQLFFDVVTKITTSTFDLEQNRKLLTPQACKEFHEKGFFTLEDLDKVWSHEKQYLSSKKLVALLEHLHILAPLEYEGKSMFFLPCALSHAPFPQADCSSLPEPLGSSKLLLVSLLVSFGCGFTPKGIFSGLIAYLLQHANENGLLWKLIHVKGLLYRDQASLWVIAGVFLTIQSTPEFLRFSLCQQSKKGSIDPPSVRRVIEDGLKEVASRLNYTVNIEPRLGFECTCETQKPIHFTEYKNEPLSECFVSGTFCEPPQDYMKWFNESQTSPTCTLFVPLSSTGTPTSTDPSSPTKHLIQSLNSLLLALRTITDPVDFGMCLDMDYARCQQLARDNAGDTRAQVRSIAAEWYQQSHHPSWEEVVEALVRHEHLHDAKRLARQEGVQLPQSHHGDIDHDVRR